MTLLASVLRMVADHFPQLIYGHPHTYLVAEVYARGVPELALVPPPDKPWLDEIPRCPVWTLGGAVVLPEVGAEVCVFFRDADKRYPVVLCFAPGVPQALDLGESEGTGELVARETDGATGGTLTFTQTIAPDPPGVTVTYAPPSGIPTVFRLDGAITVVPVVPPGAASFEIRAVIDTVGQGTVYA